MNLSLLGMIISVLVCLASGQCPIGCGCGCHQGFELPPIPNGIEVIKYGDACECGRSFPYQVERPKVFEHQDAHYNVGYKLEVPKEEPTEVKYSFDFHLERPKQHASEQLGSYGYKLLKPAEPSRDLPRYNFDYQLEMPSAQRYDSLLQGLTSNVDKVLIPKEDCKEKLEGECTCNRYRPSIEILHSCPKHGSNDYSNDIQFAKRYLTPPSSPVNLNHAENYQRPKRDITAEEYSIKNRLNNFLMNNFEMNPDYVAQSRNEEEVDLPMAKLFKVKAENFLKMLKPKIQKATNNMKNKFDQLFSKPININDIADTEHFIHKRSVEPELFKAEDMNGNKDRVRKHCPTRCAYPCMVCGGGGRVMAPPQLQSLPPQYIEFVNGQASAFLPIGGRAAVVPPSNPSPRYIFDRFGHRYLEHEGSLKLLAPSRADDGPITGSAYDGGYRQVNFNPLENILDRNSEFIDATNQGDPEHLIQDPIELVLDTLSFISDITTRDSADRYHQTYERSMAERPNQPQAEAILISVSGPVIRAGQQPNQRPNVPSTLEANKSFVDRSGKPYEIQKVQNQRIVDTFRNDEDFRRFLFGSMPQRQTELRSMLSEYMRHNV